MDMPHAYGTWHRFAQSANITRKADTFCLLSLEVAEFLLKHYLESSLGRYLNVKYI